MLPTEVRLQMWRNGYAPVPLAGKRCYLTGWETKTGAGMSEIGSWASVRPDWSNTGALTRMMPTLDLDLLNQEAACIAEDIVRRRYEGHGLVLVRIGRWPKRAVPFRLAGEPFKKISVVLIAPNGSEDESEKVEFLADGQLIAVAGRHPDTRQPYRWDSSPLWEVPREELPCVREAEAHGLVEEIAEMLAREFGYRRKASNGKRPENCTTHGPLVTYEGNGIRQELPKWLYEKLVAVMPGVRGRDQRRARGLLCTALLKPEHEQNDGLNWAAFRFRELIGAGAITRENAESLLVEVARANGYIARDGMQQAAATIRSGLGPETDQGSMWCEEEKRDEQG
jgi:hypothetical protein